MLTQPTDTARAIQLARIMFHMGMPGNNAYPYVQWLHEQLAILDHDNRTEVNDTIFKQRQGAAQAIEKQIEFINKSKDEVNRLEGL